MESQKTPDPDTQSSMDGASPVQPSNPSCDITNDSTGQPYDLGICCERCNNRLVDLKKQALRLMITQPTFTKVAIKDPAAFCERLQVPKHLKQNWMKDQCTVCTTSATQLKHEAVSMVQSLESTQVKKDPMPGKPPPTLTGSRDLASLQRYVYSQQGGEKDSKYHRQVRQGRGYPNLKGASPVVKEQTKKYLEENFPGNHSKAQLAALIAQRQQNNIGMPNGSKAAEIALGRGPVPQSLAAMPPPERIAMLQSISNQQVLMPLVSNGVLPRGQMTPAEIQVTAASLSTSAAASFFARAAQKLNLSSKKKKRHHQGCLPPELPPPDPPLFPTNFSQILRVFPPAAPPSLLRNVGRVKDTPGAGKVLQHQPTDKDRNKYLLLKLINSHRPCYDF